MRIAAETLKRYPWTSRTNAVAQYPAYVFSGFWHISPQGVITPRDPGDWGNGDLSQRATSILNGLVDYYCYSGDAAAIAHRTGPPEMAGRPGDPASALGIHDGRCVGGPAT